jgi:DEAD/DEAH box helicase domain-containing protein
VIYDSVPGGTGYLKQLMSDEHSLIDIFEKALAVLANCDCKNDPQKDGCYHCLYAYRQSRNIGQISRVTAIRLLQQILSGKGNLQEIAGLAKIPVNSLFESELERRFVAALEYMKSVSGKFEVTKEFVNNKEGYRLKAGECRWDIEPQVLLDHQFGVPVQSRADFVLWPVKNAKRQRPVVIFTDGFLYHQDKVADDTLKREAIRRSNRFRVWSLSWKDVQSVFQSQGDYATETLIPGKMPSGVQLYRPTVVQHQAQDLHPDKAGAFELLAQYLANPDAERLFAGHAKAYAMSLLEPRNVNNNIAFADWQYRIEPIIELLNLRESKFELTDTLFGKWVPRSSGAQLTILAGVASSALQKEKTNAAITVCALLDDGAENRTEKYEAEWNGFWQFFNMMQFLPSFTAVSAEGMSQAVYNAIPVTVQPESGTADQDHDSDESWAEVMNQIFDAAAKECACTLRDLGVAAPSTVGYELVDSSGAVVAECELAWENEKIALLVGEQMDHQDKFVVDGWTVLTAADSFSAAMFCGGAK